MYIIRLGKYKLCSEVLGNCRRQSQAKPADLSMNQTAQLR